MASSSRFQGYAFIAVGSNLGDSVALVRQVLTLLECWSDGPILKSSLWRTTPIDCPPGSPDFINAVAGLQARAGETPESLLTRMQQTEKAFGRRPKTVLNEPRPLDLDLIAFGTATRATASLILPHPRAHARRFVLEPLNEIAPDLILPGQARTVSELLAVLAPDPAMSRIIDP